MFNKLEQIAKQEEPSTPVLGCRISKALEPENVSDDVSLVMKFYLGLVVSDRNISVILIVTYIVG